MSVDFLPGSASLCEHLDHRVLVILRDGRHLIGKLASHDQYSNLVLEETVERRIAKSKGIYADDELGIFLVRGDNIVLLGEIDPEREEAQTALKEAAMEDVVAALQEEEEEDDDSDDEDEDGGGIKAKRTNIWNFDLC